jgi:hypothetical protein
MFRLIPIFFVAVLLNYSCERLGNSASGRLVFSSDTVYFDTVFTSVGSVTKELRVKNPGKNSLLINRIYLAGGSSSQFRLNIDGEPVNSKSTVSLDPGDSLYIFIDAYINPLDNNSPVDISDSIVFEVPDKIQSVNLMAWGQDIILIKDRLVKTETWNKGKPYVIYNQVIVDTLGTLTINEGTKILFHRNALMKVAGTLLVKGSISSPVLFATDRIEKMYEDIPGQWAGVQILKTSKGNIVNNCIIRNSTYGFQVGDLKSGSGKPDVTIYSSLLAHSLGTGISAVNSKIQAVNCVIYHCGSDCVFISGGGDYSFIFCTIFNRWDYGFRQTPAFRVSGSTQSGSDPMKLNVSSTVISGDYSSELGIELTGQVLSGVYNFDNCLIKLDTVSAKFWRNDRFNNIIINKNPAFIDGGNWDLRPDTLSPLINAGSKIYGLAYPFDFRGFSRINDEKPDIGAFERIPGEHKKQNY